MKQLILRAPEQLVYSDAAPRPAAARDCTVLRVLYSGICRTDARMWKSGHRDLILPRVPGHEIAAVDEKHQRLCTVWPGQACQRCRYCRAGLANLCDAMRILGFHEDGGFADYVRVRSECIVYVENEMPPHLLCFCEPVACVVNALYRCGLRKGSRVVIYGAGVLGLLAALVCRDKGGEPVVIEHDLAKRDKAKAYAKALQIHICKETEEDAFDIAINCCSSSEAFAQCLGKLRKQGVACFFSALAGENTLSIEILNTVHYRELHLQGSYGPQKKDMSEGYRICAAHQSMLSHLIEKLVPPESAAGCLARVAAGETYKYIIDFTQE